MIIREYYGKRPVFSNTARGAENITVVGEVSLGEQVSLWYGCVLRGDNGAILIGDESNIQDGCIIHDGAVIGRGVTVGHRAVLHGRAVCVARKPQCEKCCMAEWCKEYKSSE